MTHRIEQFESTLRRAISEFLQRDLADPRIRGMVSVTAVKVSQDMHHALVSVSVLPAEYQQLTLHGLNSAAKHIHGKLFKQLRVRRLPFLKFQIDESIKKQAEVFAAIQEGLAKENPNRSEASELPESLVTPESPETSAPSSANSPEDTQESTS